MAVWKYTFYEKYGPNVSVEYKEVENPLMEVESVTLKLFGLHFSASFSVTKS